MKALFLVAAVLSPLVASAQTPQAPASNSVVKIAPIPIVPGKSAGKVWLGATRETVHRILGKPDFAEVFNGRYQSDSWFGAPVKEWSNERARRFTVLYRNNRAVQIEFTSPNYQTAQGISTNSSLGEFRKVHRVSLRSYVFLDTDGGGGSRYYTYDDVRRGLTFALGAQDLHDARAMADQLIVHRRGVPVITDARGKRIYTRDEQPLGKGYTPLKRTS